MALGPIMPHIITVHIRKISTKSMGLHGVSWATATSTATGMSAMRPAK